MENPFYLLRTKYMASIKMDVFDCTASRISLNISINSYII